nr:MAG TPA: hypothetical protein [Caudoviricetes sp.]
MLAFSSSSSLISCSSISASSCSLIVIFCLLKFI